MNQPQAFLRQLGPGGLETRVLPKDSAPITATDAEDGAPIIRGYGSVADVWTTIGGEYGFDEMFAVGAWKQSIATADARSMKNHDINWLLGRTKPGTLRLAEDDKGLAYEVDVNPEDPNAMSTHAQVKRGDIDGSSVWFRCIEDAWVYPDATNDLDRPQRTIITAALIETGPVTFPAYEDAESSARSMQPLDAVFRAAGVKADHKRAILAAELIADPATAEEQLRHLFDSAPDLRSAVCACEVPDPIVDDAPAERAAAPAPEAPAPDTRLALAFAELSLRAAPPA